MFPYPIWWGLHRQSAHEPSLVPLSPPPQRDLLPEVVCVARQRDAGGLFPCGACQCPTPFRGPRPPAAGLAYLCPRCLAQRVQACRAAREAA